MEASFSRHSSALSPSTSSRKVISASGGRRPSSAGSSFRAALRRAFSRISSMLGPHSRMERTASPTFSILSKSSRADALCAGRGTVFSVASVMQAKVPSLPQRSWARSMRPSSSVRQRL